MYHYHTKLIMKEAHTGGSFVWHQDYGLASPLKYSNKTVTSIIIIRYWYKNGCLFPNMGTVFIAIDKCNKENGCLQVSQYIIVFSSHCLVGVERLTLSW